MVNETPIDRAARRVVAPSRAAPCIRRWTKGLPTSHDPRMNPTVSHPRAHIHIPFTHHAVRTACPRPHPHPRRAHPVRRVDSKAFVPARRVRFLFARVRRVASARAVDRREEKSDASRGNARDATSSSVGRARVGRSVVHSFVRSFPKDALSQTVADARHGVADAADDARERLGGER